MEVFGFGDAECSSFVLDFINKASSNIGMTWRSSNEHLHKKCLRSAGSESSNQKRPTYYSKKVLSTLFREKEAGSGHMSDKKVKPLFVAYVLKDLRLHRSAVTPACLRRVVKKFCTDTSEEFRPWRHEAFNFVLQILEDRPPINEENRLFWAETIAKKRYMVFELDVFTQHFIAQANDLLTKSQQPELISLLLDIFEYDYASVQLLTDASPTKILNGQLFDVHDFKDFETLPLVGLMLAQFAGTPRKCVFSVVKGRPVEVGRLFVEKFCQCEDVRLQQLYVRLLGLLLDAMFYLTSRKVYERCRTTRDVKRLPLPVKNVVKQTVVKGLPEERRAELTAKFTAFNNVAWINELIDEPVK